MVKRKDLIECIEKIFHIPKNYFVKNDLKEWIKLNIKSQKSKLYKMEFPTLYGTEKNGKTKIWKATIEKNGDNATVTIEYGQLDGKKQISTREYTSGKNIGKKNETTPYTQCFLETERKWKDKKEKEDYKELDDESENKVENPGKFFPMLAGKYEPNTDKKKRTDIEYPCFVQPKLDGLRCLMYMKDGKVIAQSRTGTYFDSVQHITSALLSFFKSFNVVLDGELYTNEIPFEVLAGIIKKKKISDEDRIKLNIVKYHIYDMIDPDTSLPFIKRYEFISKNVPRHKNIEIVDTILVKSVDEFKTQFATYIEQGYEGIMLRNINSVYRQGFRSNDLQKYKEFQEEEYVITGFDQGVGRDQGTVIWKCENKDGREFNVRPKGTIEFRKELFKNGRQYIGKKLTVIFQELSELGIPRFPVGKAIRDNY